MKLVSNDEGYGKLVRAELDEANEAVGDVALGIEAIIEAANLLEKSAYQLCVVQEPAKTSNLINLSAYLQRFAERCKNDIWYRDDKKTNRS